MNNTEQDPRAGLDSASSAERTHFCPGWLNLRRNIPADRLPQSDSEIAKEGSLIHKALETGDSSDLDMTQAEIAEVCAKLEDDALQAWWKTMPEPRDTNRLEKLREARFWIHNESMEPITSGQVDVSYVMFDHALVIDFKTGYKPTTPAQRNFQMKVQAVSVWREYGVAHVRVAIAQHRFTSILSQADYDEAALERAYAEILQDQWRAQQPDAPRVPGSWCNYCPCKAWCREGGSYSAMSLVVATNAAPANLPKEELLAAIQSMAPADLMFLWKRKGIIEKVLEAVVDRLKAMPDDELAAIGLKKEDGRNKADVKDAGAIIDKLQDDGMLNDEEVIGCFNLVFGRLEEIVLPRMVAAAGAAGEKLSQKAAKDRLRKMIQENGWIDFEGSKTAPILKEIAL